MNRKNFIHQGIIGLCLILALFVSSAQADVPTYSLSLTTSSTSNGSTPIASFAPGSDLYLVIKANELKDVAGCAFILTYPDIVTPPAMNADGTPVNAGDIQSPFGFTFVKAGHSNTGAVTSRENTTESGKIYFSGATIDTATGGAKYAVPQDGNTFPLFIVKFQVKPNAPTGTTTYSFSLSQTVLNNTAAGYNAAGEGVPVLVGAVPSGDANWSNLSVAFPTLLQSLAVAPTATFDIPGITTYSISGTISYNGKQVGNLYVGANSSIGSSGCSGLVGQGSMTAWPGSGGAFTLNNIPTGSNVYLCAYLDAADPSTSANGARDAWEAKGVYPNMTSPTAITVTANATGKDFAIIDPDANGNELADWWEVKYGLYSPSNPISKNGDQDNDGYPNIVEYQGYSSTTGGKNPTVQDLPGDTGYVPAQDNRFYKISGSATYSGTKTGTLYCGLLNAGDSTLISGTVYSVGAWSGTSKNYSWDRVNGTYKVGCFISNRTSPTPTEPDATEAQGMSGQVNLAGATQTVNVALTDPDARKQIVSVSPAAPRARANSSFAIDVFYTTSDNNKATSGMTIRMHYDSRKMTFNEISNKLTTGFSGGGVTPYADSTNADGDANTDKYVQIAWTDQSKNWPGVDLPVRLFTAKFDVADLADGTESNIRFTWVDGDFDYVFAADPVNFKVQLFNLNVDGSTEQAPQSGAKAYSDGLLIIRYLLGFQDTDLTQGLIPPNATRTTPEAIQGYLDGAGKTAESPLNVDGSTETTQAAKAYSDGLLIIRYLLGFQDTDLTQGLIPPNAARTAPEAIKAFLDPLKP